MKKVLLNDYAWKETVSLDDFLVIYQECKGLETRQIILFKKQAELLRQFLNKNKKKLKENEKD